LIRIGIWSRGLMGQVLAVLLTAIVLEFLGSAVLYEYFESYSTSEEWGQQLTEQLLVADRLVSAAPIEKRPQVADQLSQEHLAFHWSHVPVRDQTGQSRTLQRLRQHIVGGKPGIAHHEVRLAQSRIDQAHIDGTLRLDDGSFLHFRARTIGGWETFYKSFLSFVILILGVLLAAALVIRTLGAPLRELASAADAAGHGTPVVIPERGPRDLRVVAQAFNALQVRIAGLLDSRTKALAAVSHDLRTPLSRLRLWAEQIDDGFTRAAMSKDIDEMGKMLDSILTYLAGESGEEKPRLTDLASLAMTVADEAADTGKAAEYRGPDSLHLVLRTLRVKRAIGNLVENAINYGDRAVITLHADKDGTHLVVEDEGPGIPPEQLVSVLEPFKRLDEARPRNTDGVGLGLPIVHSTMTQEGGELRLSNRLPHGLRAELFFPAVRNTLK
jgi:signal transduction histidine kinase